MLSKLIVLMASVSLLLAPAPAKKEAKGSAQENAIMALCAGPMTVIIGQPQNRFVTLSFNIDSPCLSAIGIVLHPRLETASKNRPSFDESLRIPRYLTHFPS